MQYPTWRYHATLPARIVQTPDEEAALGDGWADSPGAALTLAERAQAAATAAAGNPEVRKPKPAKPATADAPS